MTLILFVFVLGIIIFVHELGHFILAKKAGIHVYEFSLGMGPRIWKFKRKNDETEYSLRLFPIGGFVSIAGEEVDDNKDLPKGKKLQDKTWLQRFLVMIAGATFNFIFAILILFVISLFTGSTTLAPIIGDVSEGYPAQIIGLETGDKITSINGKKVFTWDDALVRMTEKKAQDTIKMEVIKKDGSKKTYTMESVKTIVISKINHPEIRAGSIIKTVNKQELTNVDEIYQLLNNGDVEVTIETAEGIKTYQLNKSNNLELSVAKKYGLGQGIETTSGFINAIKYSFTKFISLIYSMFVTIADLFNGQIGLNNMAGPVGIYDIVGSQAKAGADSLFLLIAYLSINVGFINLIPFPAFDGGKVLFLIIEKLKGSPVNPKIENICHTIGFMLLMGLMLFITFNDILRR